MTKFSLKTTIIRGIALALPLSVVLYVLYKFMKIFESLIGPIAKKFQIEHIFGEITLTFFAVLAMLAIAFLLGLLMRINSIANIRREVEALVLKFIPSLNYLELMAADRLHADNIDLNWKPVLVLKGDQYFPAYVLEENEEWITLVTVRIPNTDPVGMMLVKQSSVKCIPITMKEMRLYNKQFGKGYIDKIK